MLFQVLRGPFGPFSKTEIASHHGFLYMKGEKIIRDELLGRKIKERLIDMDDVNDIDPKPPKKSNLILQ